MRREEIIGNARLILGDARDVLPSIGPIDAMVTDPPYGIGEAAGKNKSRGLLAMPRDYGDDCWDDQTVAIDVMRMVHRSARWRIIFGGNYYDVEPSSCWLVWDKENGETDFADCELAWTNLPKAARLIRFRWNGMLRKNNEPRGDHPTQKPVGVMEWALGHLPKDTHSVLDPFMGSGTTGVAAAKFGMSFTGIEREPKYFETALRRIEAAQRQSDLFVTPPAAPQPVTGELFL